jgi:ribose/xylose/arabinose/galactoside ABC-type transport system permease subunit
MSNAGENGSTGEGAAGGNPLQRGIAWARENMSYQQMQQATIIALLIALCIYAGFRSPNFLTWHNIVNNLFTNATIVGVIALGMTLVMVGGGFDLSVASTTVVCTVVFVQVMNGCAGQGRFVAILAGVGVTALVGIVLGLVNGALISYVGVNAFVVTLSTMKVFRGLALIITGGGQSQQLKDLELQGSVECIYDAKILFIPAPVIIFACVFAVGIYVLKYTRFGHYVYALGGNEQATWLAGINTRLVKAATYAICGLTCAIAAVIIIGKTGTAGAESYQGLELLVIASVIVGGTPLGGGSGGLGFTLTGILLLKVIENLLTQFSVGSEYREIVSGLIILIVVTVDVLVRKRGRR